MSNNPLPIKDNNSSTSPTTNSNIHACAACRFQRRKCPPNCILAPYFPADKHQQFINAYRLFGVNNIVKTLTSVAPNLRDDAMTSIIYTANARAKDPVGGCKRIVESLIHQLTSLEDQLHFYMAQIAAFKGVDLQAVVHGPCPLNVVPALDDFSEGIFDTEDFNSAQIIKSPAALIKFSDQMYDDEGINPTVHDKLEPTLL